MQENQNPAPTFSAEELAAQGYDPSVHPAFEGNVLNDTEVAQPTPQATSAEVVNVADSNVAEIATGGLALAAAAVRETQRIHIDGTTGVVMTADEAARRDRVGATSNH